MAGFWRRQHTRTNAHGTTFSVRAHGVNRETYRLTRRGPDRFVNGTLVWQFDCPTCGQLVWFYKNAHGSKVWFEKLGAPWPKHDCGKAQGFDWDARIEDTRAFIKLERERRAEKRERRIRRRFDKKRTKGRPANN